MNFLAHLYLAPQDEEIRLGCFIADAVKGSHYLDYSSKTQEGILLHRRQDSYTDNHLAIRESVIALRPAFRLYAGVVIDIYNDHFLAKNWERYSSVSLSDFAMESYRLIDKYEDILPEKTKEVFSYMKRNNWLENYKDIPFLKKVFLGMSRRTPFESNMEQAVTELEKQYDYLESQFHLFFADCIKTFRSSDKTELS